MMWLFVCMHDHHSGLRGVFRSVFAVFILHGCGTAAFPVTHGGGKYVSLPFIIAITCAGGAGSSRTAPLASSPSSWGFVGELFIITVFVAFFRLMIAVFMLHVSCAGGAGPSHTATLIFRFHPGVSKARQLQASSSPCSGRTWQTVVRGAAVYSQLDTCRREVGLQTCRHHQHLRTGGRFAGPVSRASVTGDDS